MPAKSTTRSTQVTAKRYGLILHGYVVARSRRLVGESQRPVLRYRVLAGDQVYDVDWWETPETKPLKMHEEVALSVRVNAFTGRNGTMFNLVVVTDEDKDGLADAG